MLIFELFNFLIFDLFTQTAKYVAHKSSVGIHFTKWL